MTEPVQEVEARLTESERKGVQLCNAVGTMMLACKQLRALQESHHAEERIRAHPKQAHKARCYCGMCRIALPDLSDEAVGQLVSESNAQYDEMRAAVEKLRAWTDPDAMLSPPVGDCVSCRQPEVYVYHVPEVLWRRVVPEKWWNEVVCAGCFHRFAVADQVTA